jgi:hypothetical protein
MNCPFFRRSALAVVAKFLHAKPGDDIKREPGDCMCPTQMPGSVTIDRSPLPVEDGRDLPRWCPLRIGDVTVTIAT